MMLEMAGNKLDESADIRAKTANTAWDKLTESAKAYAKTAIKPCLAPHRDDCSYQ
ncbi:MAG: hypothetical protein R3E93_12560 [Thiothrix sp.]